MGQDNNNRTVVVPAPPPEDERDEEIETSSSGFPHLKLIIILGLGIPLIFFASQVGLTTYQRYLEHTPPEIQISSPPRGIGLTTVAVSAQVKDVGAGLDEVDVSFKQRGKETKLLKRSLDGESSTELNIEFPGDKSIADEGSIELVIKAFDKSFWSNKGELTVPIRVDYHRPKIEVVSAQHNARRGGSQLVIYRAFDEDLAETGVKVGTQLFTGYPARGIDKELDKQELFVSLYTPDFRNKSERAPPRLFAEDRVGNVSTVDFYNKIAERGARQVTVKVNDTFMRDRIPTLIEQASSTIDEWAQRSGQSAPKGKGKSGKELLEYNFGIANDLLRSESEIKLASLLKGPKYERLWSGVFDKPVGSVDLSFGDMVNYEYENRRLGSALELGYEIKMPATQRDVTAMNDGLVIFSDNIGIYGRTIGIDHGLGLVSIYAHLNASTVNKGDKVSKGQTIGEAGTTGLTQDLGVLIQLRLHGVPVDLVEWWDKDWYYNHIVEKINDVKKVLGIATFVPLETALP